jgi:hypothetical protein
MYVFSKKLDCSLARPYVNSKYTSVSCLPVCKRYASILEARRQISSCTCIAYTWNVRTDLSLLHTIHLLGEEEHCY